MLATMDSNEERLSSALTGTGARCWRAVQLTLAIPLFFPTWVSEEDGDELLERALLVHEQDFLDLLCSMGAKSLRHLQYLAPVDSPPGRWHLLNIQKVWSAGDDADRIDHLVLEDESGVQFMHFGGGMPFTLQRQLWPVA